MLHHHRRRPLSAVSILYSESVIHYNRSWLEAPPPPPPPGSSQSRKASCVPLIPLHWRPVLKPPASEPSLWSNLPRLKIDKEKLEEQFKLLPQEQRKMSVPSKQKPKILNVLDLKVNLIDEKL